jgi:hypothetical protein
LFFLSLLLGFLICNQDPLCFMLYAHACAPFAIHNWSFLSDAGGAQRWCMHITLCYVCAMSMSKDLCSVYHEVSKWILLRLWKQYRRRVQAMESFHEAPILGRLRRWRMDDVSSTRSYAAASSLTLSNLTRTHDFISSNTVHPSYDSGKENTTKIARKKEWMETSMHARGGKYPQPSPVHGGRHSWRLGKRRPATFPVHNNAIPPKGWYMYEEIEENVKICMYTSMHTEANILNLHPFTAISTLGDWGKLPSQ